jgi:excisionase family DNA binding protein
VANPTTWLSLKGAAEHTQLSTATIVRAVKRRELEAYRVRGQRLLRFRAQDLDKWLESHRAVMS